MLLTSFVQRTKIPKRKYDDNLNLTSPTTGTTKPAPTEIITLLIGSVKPVGAPLTAGSPVRERGVFAMHTGNLL